MDVVLALTMAPASASTAIADGLVTNGLAACVNRFAGGHSVFEWQGKIERADEELLLIKCAASRLGEVEAWIGEHHPYDVPEFVVLRPEHVNKAYADWVLGKETVTRAT